MYIVKGTPFTSVYLSFSPQPLLIRNKNPKAKAPFIITKLQILQAKSNPFIKEDLIATTMTRFVTGAYSQSFRFDSVK